MPKKVVVEVGSTSISSANGTPRHRKMVFANSAFDMPLADCAGVAKKPSSK